VFEDQIFKGLAMWCALRQAGRHGAGADRGRDGRKTIGRTLSTKVRSRLRRALRPTRDEIFVTSAELRHLLG